MAIKQSFHMSAVNRERALEIKLNLLEQRLVLVERFIEVRFYESFSNVLSKDGDQARKVDGPTDAIILLTEQPFLRFQATKSEAERDGDPNDLMPRRTRSGRSSRRPARLSPSDDVSHTSTVSTKKKSTVAVAVEIDKLENRQDHSKSTNTVNESEHESCLDNTDKIEYFEFSDDELGELLQVGNEPEEREIRMRDVEDDSNLTEKKPSKLQFPKKGTEENWEATRIKPILCPYSTKKNDGSAPGATLTLQSSTREQCQVCKKFFRKELMPGHMEYHTKERHLKCSFCDKTFFNRGMVIKHEKIHQPEKFSKKCRLCEKKTIESGKMLVHERSCIRRALARRHAVDPALMQEIRRRSPGMDLKWPNLSESGTEEPGREQKKCNYCSKYFNFGEYSKHVKTHATWLCSLCKNSYMNKEGLAKHMRNVHEVKPTLTLVDGEKLGSFS